MSKQRKARRSAPCKFKGWDWTEILEAVGVDLDELPGEPDEANHRAEMDRRIAACFGCGEINETDENRVFITACRAHLDALAETAVSYEAPVWAGLAKVNHDWTFMQFVRDLYPRMWT